MPALVTIGSIVKAHGLGGEVAVHLMSDVEGRFDAGTDVVVAGKPMVIATCRPHQGKMLVRFEGVSDRTGAEALRGAPIEAEPLDVSEWDTYFVHELVGSVVELDGQELGQVETVIELPAAAAYDLLEVRRADGTTWMLPAVDEFVEVVERVDGHGLRIVLIDPPFGLVDAGCADQADS